MERASETLSNSVEEDIQVSKEKELDLLKKMDQILKELKQQIIGKEVEAAKEKRPKTVIEAKASMSEWCDARGKQGTDDLLIKCLALAYLKNPHLNDETYEWILWTWEMKESLKVEKMTSEGLLGAYEKVLKQKVLAELNLGLKENYEKETVNGDDEPGLVADLLQGLNLSMDDNNKMFKLGNTRVKKEKKLVDVYADTNVSLNLEEGRPKRTTRGQAPSYLRDFAKK